VGETWVIILWLSTSDHVATVKKAKQDP